MPATDIEMRTVTHRNYATLELRALCKRSSLLSILKDADASKHIAKHTITPL
jgi:hypothetical protein